MTKINFDLTSTIEAAAERAKSHVDGEIQRTAQSICRDLLYDGKYARLGKEGAVHELIRKKLEDYVLSEKFEQKVEAFIEQSVDPSMEEALMLLMRSKARKALFQPTSPVTSERA